MKTCLKIRFFFVFCFNVTDLRAKNTWYFYNTPRARCIRIHIFSKWHISDGFSYVTNLKRCGNSSAFELFFFFSKFICLICLCQTMWSLCFFYAIFTLRILFVKRQVWCVCACNDRVFGCWLGMSNGSPIIGYLLKKISEYSKFTENRTNVAPM